MLDMRSLKWPRASRLGMLDFTQNKVHMSTKCNVGERQRNRTSLKTSVAETQYGGRGNRKYTKALSGVVLLKKNYIYARFQYLWLLQYMSSSLQTLWLQTCLSTVSRELCT